ncbi:MAG TPA: DUF47 family protein [Thermomicrobiales bacterium]|nr:DUF47 family protein [Thermomicrobiales bacterium]
MIWRRTPDPTFLTLLERSASFTVDAANALVQLFEGEISDATFVPLDDIEHRADANTHDLLLRLERGHTPSLPAPVMRQLALEIDEIVDAIEGAAEIAVLAGVRQATPIARDMAGVLVRITREVASLVSYIEGGSGHRPYMVRIHEYEGEGDTLWEASYRSLFDGTMEFLDVIRWKDIYARLEDAIDGCEIAAKTIERAIGRE